MLSTSHTSHTLTIITLLLLHILCCISPSLLSPIHAASSSSSSPSPPPSPVTAAEWNSRGLSLAIGSASGAPVTQKDLLAAAKAFERAHQMTQTEWERLRAEVETRERLGAAADAASSSSSLRTKFDSLSQRLAEYVNNHAVASMRLGRMDAARRLLLHALDIVPDHVDAKDNLKEVEEWSNRQSHTEADAAEEMDAAADDENDADEVSESTMRGKKRRGGKKSQTRQSSKSRRSRRSKKNEKRRHRNEDDEEDPVESVSSQESARAPESADDDVYSRPAKRQPQRSPPPLKKSKKSKRKKSKKSSKKATKKMKAPLTALDMPRRPNTNPREKLPRIHISHMYLDENEVYRSGLAPFVLLGALDSWNLSSWSPAALASRFPSSIVDFYPHNMGKSNVRPFLVPMAEAVAEQANPSGRFPTSQQRPGTYIQWNVNNEDWTRVRKDMTKRLPAQFREDDSWLLHVRQRCLHSTALQDLFTLRTHWRMVIIGNRGAGMFNHQDVLRTASYQAQLAGSKRWHLCDPSQSRYLYGAGTVDTFDPDYDRYPLFHQARCYEDIIEAGEVIFYPADYWHQTENLATPTISLTTTIMDANNYEWVMEELRAECVNQKYKWGFSKELCDALLNKCFDFWREQWSQPTKHTYREYSPHVHDEL